jgi:uncharacterized protein (DUF2141 family)
MLKVPGPPKFATLVAIAAFGTPFAAAATPLGPQAGVCENNGPAVLVNIEGFKARTGSVRVQLYVANAATFLEKGKWISRVDVPVSASGPIAVCVPVPKAGNYAVSVRHDLNGNGKGDMHDGGGFSGNPKVSVWDYVFGRKPNIDKVQFAVSGNTRQVEVTLRYA